MSLLESLATIKEHPRLFVPVLARYVVSPIVGLFFYYLMALLVLKTAGMPLYLEWVNPALTNPRAFLVAQIVSVLILFVMWLINIFFRAWQYAWTAQALDAKNAWSFDTLKSFLVFSFLRLGLYVVAAIPLIVGYLLTNVNPLVAVGIFLFGAVLFVVLAPLIWFGVLFGPPQVFLEGKPGVDACKDALRYVIKKPAYLFKTGVVMLALWVCFIVPFGLFTLIFRPDSVSAVILGLFSLINWLGMQFMHVWLGVYVFKAYQKC